MNMKKSMSQKLVPKSRNEDLLVFSWGTDTNTWTRSTLTPYNFCLFQN